MTVAPMRLEEYRRFYAEEIRLAANLHSPALVEAFARVPREEFMGAGPWRVASPEQIALAMTALGGTAYSTTGDARDLYHNILVALDESGHKNNGQPSALARWISALELRPGDRVFHLGCGVGYYTAILAEVVGTGGKITAAEIDPDLACRAKANLSNYANVAVHEADGAVLDPGECDAMLINAGVTHPHGTWLDRLAEGGRLVLPLTARVPGAPYGNGVMARVVRVHGGFAARAITFVAIYSCTTVRDPQREPLLQKAFATQALLKVRSVRRDPHEADGTCVIHGADACLSSAEPFAEQS